MKNIYLTTFFSLKQIKKTSCEEKCVYMIVENFWHFFRGCVMDLDWQNKVVIFKSLLTTFKASVISLRQLGYVLSENQLEPKTKPP